MGTGQTLLTIAALMLLGTVILSTNGGIQNSKQVLLSTNFGLESVSLATSTIEKAQNLAFDAATDTQAVNVANMNLLTAPSSLGQENNDANDLNDFDDYNGLNNGGRLEVDTLSTGIYFVRTRVYYVARNQATGTLDSSATRTWSKRMDVWVWNKEDSTTVVRTSTVFSYWYFN